MDILFFVLTIALASHYSRSFYVITLSLKASIALGSEGWAEILIDLYLPRYLVYCPPSRD